MSNLKPCPFCGDNAELRGGKGVASWIICNNTKCRATQGLELTGENAVKMWNTRHAEDAKDREIDRLKAEVTRYRRALHNLKEDCQKRLHWKNCSWERLFLHEVITHIDAELDFTPDTGKMEAKPCQG